MLTTEDQDQKAFLLQRIRKAEAVLVLGAGASKGCTTRSGEALKDGRELAEVLVTDLGYAYQGEALSDAVSAYEERFGTDPLRTRLRREFKNCKPSPAMQSLFSYVWARVYTWNIDDSLKEASRHGAQRAEYYNGLVEKVAVELDPSVLQTVFLHGDVWKLEDGFVFSREDYASQLANGQHFWYQQLAQDCRAYTPVFIGSSLNEPILEAELARLSKQRDGGQGYGFVITPGELSKVQIDSLKRRKLIHLRGTLEDFVEFLRTELGSGVSLERVLQEKNQFNQNELGALNSDDLAAAYSLYPVKSSDLKDRLHALESSDLQQTARKFLLGFAPDWLIAASQIPVRLEALGGLRAAMGEALHRRAGLFTVIGQAGSGKTTALMQAVLDLSGSGDVSVYEISNDAPSIRKALNLIGRIDARPKIMFIRDLFVFGSSLAEDLEYARRNNVLLVSSARSSEWAEYLSIHFGRVSDTFEFQRFSRADFDPLIDRVIEYVPAPAFRKLSRDDQRKRLGASKSQLLIALRQATGSPNFDETVMSEFEKLPDRDTKLLFLLVGVATLARVGIRPEMAAEAFEDLSPDRPYESACNALSGIVGLLNSNRLAARHEFYVRKVIERKSNFDYVAQVIKAMLNTYLKYEIPISRHTSRSDAVLFRFLFNHDFLMELASLAGNRRAALQIYQSYEIEFQLDGHFWLQYGLYTADVADLGQAILLLQRSLQAFPGNEYAKHALADLQLRAARERAAYDHETRSLIEQAVKTLELMDANPHTSLTQYPIITLSFGHIGTLIKHRREAEARDAARQYYDRLLQLDRSQGGRRFDQAKEALLKFVTVGVWGREPRNA